MSWGSGATAASVAVIRQLVRRGTFDGNTTFSPSAILFPEPEFETVTPRAIELLTAMTSEGDVGWVVVVPPGYRV